MSVTFNDNSPSTYGIISANHSWKNQDVDSLEVTLARGLSAASVFPAGTQIIVKTSSGIPVFRGWAKPHEIIGSGRSQTHKVIFEGPWRDLGRRTITDTVTYHPGGTPAAFKVSQTAPVFVISDNRTLRQAVAAGLGGVAGFTVGTNATPTINLPETVMDNPTYLDVLRYALRYAPGTLTWVNYQANSFNAISQSLTTASQTISDADLISINIARRNDLAVAGVHIMFDRDVAVSETENWHDEPMLYTLPRRIGTSVFPAGAQAYAANVLTQRVKLRGTDRFYSQNCARDSMRLGQFLKNGATNSLTAQERERFAAFWLRHGLNVGAGTGLSVIDTVISTASPLSASIPTTDYVPANLYAMVNPTNNRSTALNKVFWYAPEHPTGFHIVNVRVSQNISGTVHTATALCMSEGTILPGGFNVKRYISDPNNQPIPIGIAEAIFNARNAEVWEGQVVVKGISPDYFGKNRFQVRGEWVTGIQEIRYDTAEDQTTLIFGPGDQLGVQDYISLLRPRIPGK